MSIYYLTVSVGLSHVPLADSQSVSYGCGLIWRSD